MSDHGHQPGLSAGARGPQAVKALLQQALRFSEADETELVFTGSEEALTRFAHNAIHQNVAEIDASVDVRAVLGSRVGAPTAVGAATTNDLSASGLERAVRQATDMARHLPNSPDWPGLPDPQSYPEMQPAYDPAVAALCADPGQRARAVADLCAQARSAGVRASGVYSAARYEYAVLPRAIAPGDYPVVLEPYAVLTLIEAMVEDGMGALAVQEGRSWMNHHMGERCMSPLISIMDDAFDPDGYPSAACRSWRPACPARPCTTG
jgi:predicted Zn-dependent protease